MTGVSYGRNSRREGGGVRGTVLFCVEVGRGVGVERLGISKLSKISFIFLFTGGVLVKNICIFRIDLGVSGVGNFLFL